MSSVQKRERKIDENLLFVILKILLIKHGNDDNYCIITII